MADKHFINLEICDESGPIKQLSLTGEHLTIGRAKDCAIQLDRTTVSRKHAEMYVDPLQQWWIKDAGSRNGTFVNTQQARDSHLLRAGDHVGVGEFTLKITALSGRTSPARLRPEESRVTVSETASAEINSLQDLAPPRIASSHLSILNEFGARLLGMDDPSLRLREVCRLLVRDEFLGRCAMVLRVPRDAGDDQPLVICPAEFNPRAKGWTPYVSRTLLRVIAEKPEPLLASNVPSSAEVLASDISLSPAVMAISTVACPIRIDERSLDVLYVVLPPECGTSEWLALASLATKQYQQGELVIAAREHAAVERELGKAREIQQRLVPKQPRFPGIELSLGFQPCRWVGGDYVDALRMPDGRTLLIVADVCGKGLPAALVASSLHTTVRIGIKSGLSLRTLAATLNDYLLESLLENSFVTLVALTFDPATGQVECVNAGHPAALLINARGEVRKLQNCANMPLGIAAMEIESEADRIEPGELLVLYSDGLPDLCDSRGERIGTQRLMEILQEFYAKENACDVPALGQKLTAMLDAYQEGNAAPDDRTFLLGRRM